MSRRLALALLVAALAACAPAAAPPPPPIETGAVPGEVGFYPSASGLAWRYARTRADGTVVANEAPFELRVEGPASFQGQILTSVRFFGQGQEWLYYRDFSEAGVRLFGQVAPEFVTVTYDPPILEYPPQPRLSRGYSWGGETKVTYQPKNVPARTVTLTYLYRVLGEEKFRVGDAEYTTVIINLDQRLSTGDPVPSQTIRFAPKIGEVRTREGLVLVGKNF